MKKTVKIISLVVLALIIFVGGYFSGSVNSNEVSREILIGYNDNENPSRVNFPVTFNDRENQSIIDNMLMIYLHKEKTENGNIEAENPDIYIKVSSPKQSVGLIDSKVWFLKNGAVIGLRTGDSWDNVEYYEIDESETDYIKGIIDYQ
ncbi:hypothetical protein SAMN04488100_11810 [Alkalibacterium putridalgicola]|uniref:Uncharacterized protein n=1 Tax=Alkalibacterium putridalgicola TaxID=426703 RepID=A0A1H7UK72_9LACT|nr:hypothetical protein [Alkalibacterium putridalgicola]GEK88280.1 hypothetical protein APU01nite_03190 [Alkalibacterium putridalgicola]SEL96697.1 hypothetical protein SAMN04488100_11810 [Alkalibacterium putridalgicola]